MKEEKKIFALGFFDGVHLGHQALLRECAALAKALDAETAAITFEQHPLSLFSNQIPPLLGSLSDRFELLRRYGIDHIVPFPVTHEVMATNWRDFLEELVIRGAAGFVCGDDFRFGHKGGGNAGKLRDFCAGRDLACVIVPQQTINGIRISSSHIRALIQEGDMEQAAVFLGHPHILSGEVVHGRQLGRTIGVPTANILIPEGTVVPKLGVYACLCSIGGKDYVAVTNIGSRPTVGGHQVRAESWILDFEGDLYGRTVTLKFIRFLREERKFDTLEALKAQIQADAAQALRLLR